jgi:hypothetical protein
MLQYFLYNTLYGNTIVDRSDTSFSPVPPYGEIYIDFSIPEIQPLYFYANSGGTGGTIIVNSQANIDAYLGSTEVSPTADGNVTYGEFTGTTDNLQIQINALSGATTGNTLQQVTLFGAITNIESTFSSGLKTNKIRPTGDTVTAVQINKADGITPVISVDTVSGLTGFGMIAPQGVIHAYGSDANEANPLSTEKNGVIIDGPLNVDKDIQWAENGIPKWLAETYRNENSKFWYLYNVEAQNSPLTIMETGRIGINKNTNLMDDDAAQIVGTGLSDLTISGNYTENYNAVYRIEIGSTGIIDEWKWKKSIDGGVTFNSYSPLSACTTGATLIEFGIYIQFGSVNGHTVGNVWEFAGFTQIPQATLSLAPMGFSEIQSTNDYTAPTIVYKDLTALANGGFYDNKFTIFNTGTGGTIQAFYWGTAVQINSVYFNLHQVGESIVLVTEYWNGTSWIALNFNNFGLIDATENLTRSGRIIWTPSHMVDWVKANIPDLIDVESQLYWMRIRTSTNPTIAPEVHTISVGNDKRFAVYNSFNDYRPSAYIDSLGRMNIGGGNISGNNKLQVNTSNKLQIAATGGTDSLVEFDNDNGALTNLKLKLSTEDACSAQLDFAKTRGTLDEPTSLCKGDMIGKINFRGRVGTNGCVSSFISAQYTGVKDTTRCSDIIFGTSCGAYDTSAREIVRMTSSGTTGFGISGVTAVVDIKAGTTSIAPLKFHQGSLLSIPQVGAMEFDGHFIYITDSGTTRNTLAYLNDPVFTGNVYLPSGTVYADGIRTNEIKPLNDGYDTLKIIGATGGTVLVTFNSLSGFTGFGTIIPETLVHLYGANAVEADGWNYQTNGVRLDGTFNTDKDIQWASEGQPKFTAQIYRCEDGKFWYLSSPQGRVNQLTVSNTGRVGINNQTNIMAYHAALISGGPNDINVSGTYTQNYTSVYQIEIDSITGATDTFRWRTSTDEGHSYDNWSASIDLDYAPTEIEYGVSIRFDQLTGHTLGTTWIFGAFAQLPIGTFVITPNRFTEVQTTNNYNANPVVYNDVTAEANSSSYGSDILIFHTGVTNNAIYFGALDKLNIIYTNLETFGQGVTLITEYWNGVSWIAINLINNAYVDGTNNLTRSGGITWETNSMTGWIPAYIPDKVEEGYLLYWLRLRTSTNATIAPIANSFARGGNYRLAVLTSPSDFKPSMYVDSIGRTSIGGGNIVGNNILQVNSAYNIPPSTSAPSLVEIDSEDSGATDLKIRLSSNDSCGTGIVFGGTRGTLATPLNAQYNDEIAHVYYRTLAGSSGYNAAGIQAIYKGNSTTKNTDLILSTSNATTFVEGIRISGDYVGFGGIDIPTARIHIQSGSTTIAPLKFTSGSLLTSPQAGVVEYNGNAFYGTPSGGTRKTFAFLESPVFTGFPVLPVNTILVGQNLCNFIWYSGGTSNACLTSRIDFNAYTASTTTAISNVVTGFTNGLTRTGCHTVEFGGPLTHSTQLGCNQYDFLLCVKKLDIWSHEGTDIFDRYGCDVNIFSCGGNVSLRGETSGGTYATRFTLNENQALMADARPIPRGIEYCQDYSATYTSRSLVDKEYVDAHSGGLQPKSSVLAATQANINLSSAPATIDSITPPNGSRILVKAQSSAVNNGIYIYNGSGSAMTRATDYASGSTQFNAYMGVTSGSTDANKSWILSSVVPITVGVNNSDFVLFTSSSGVIGGNGICVTQTGGNYNVEIKTPANCGLCSDASGLYINSNIAGTGLAYNTGVLSICGSSLAGNSICWSTGNTFNVDISTGTLSTALNSKLNTSAFNLYSASTLTNINNRLLTSVYSTYTGTTAPNRFLDKTIYQTYTGTTVPNNYYNKTQINSYTGATNTAIGLKAPSASPTFTGTVRSVTPAANDNSTCIATTAWYLGQCASATPSMNGTGTVGTSTCWAHSDHVHPSDTSRLSTSAFITYSGTTAPGQFVSKSIYQTYTGTTAPNTYLSKSAFNTYSGTTVPANYYNKTQINSYTGATNTKINNKLWLSGGTMTGVLNVCKPAQNDNTSCAASTSWYISQAGTASPLMNGIVAVGTSNLFSRQDHRHPVDTSRLATTGGTVTGNLNLSGWLKSSCYCMGSDLTIYPIVGNQSAIRTYWGLQLRGYGQSNYELQPVAVGTCDSYSVVVITDTGFTPTVSTLSVVAAPTQTTGVKLQTWQKSNLTTVASIDCNGGFKTTGNITGSTVYLTTTPQPIATIQQPSLFWNSTTKQIEAKTLTGGSDQYFYGESTTNRTTSSTTCIKAQGLSGTTLAGRYRVDFNLELGNASSNACSFAALKVDGTTWGSNYLYRTQVAASVQSVSMSRDITLTNALHCFDIWYWNSAGTACVPISSIRVLRIC